GELRVDRRTAKRLKLRRVVVGRSTRRLRRAGKVTFVVKPSSAARRSLRRARRSVTLTLRTTMDPTRGKTRRTGKQFVVVR
ncbi:MAG: hypothetical protein H0U32_11190, partial [Thermoleophilaceae bacterium]|nr:hypothetical protein [Thermoleophilaceae bacterium]